MKELVSKKISGVNNRKLVSRKVRMNMNKDEKLEKIMRGFNIETREEKIERLKRTYDGRICLKLYEALYKYALINGPIFRFTNNKFLKYLFESDKELIDNSSDLDLLRYFQRLDSMELIEIEGDFIEINDFKVILNLEYRKKKMQKASI